MTGPIAYFSMEIALDSAIPTYAGGLGVLAGDTLRAAADLGVPMIGVTLLHRRGYFRQRLDASGVQRDDEQSWDPATTLEAVSPTVSVTIEGKPVKLRGWRYTVLGIAGDRVPVYLLDARLPENAPEHRGLTDHLYGGDQRYRLCQELILGAGGVALLEALGHEVATYHMNEGHSALLAPALVEREAGPEQRAVESIRARCVFTTHTPVPAGHDQFSIELARQVIGRSLTDRLQRIGCCIDGTLNLTHVALFFSRFINGVAMRHGEISRGMFPGYPIASITNGVHATSWTAPPFAALFDRHIPDWRQQNDNLRYAVKIGRAELDAAHRACKAALLSAVKARTGVELAPDTLTLGFARRATAYKRATLLLSDRERLRRIAATWPLQIVYAGKAHPRDEGGKEMIRQVFALAEGLRGAVEVIYLEDHDMDLGRLLCSGVDLWINTPKKPEEASGTSGMKAALNGVPSLSVLDGWWIEGHVDGVTGWSIGDSWEPDGDVSREIDQLYRRLEEIAELYYRDPEGFSQIRRHAIALNGSFFNAQRMVEQYMRSAYRQSTTG